MRKTIIVTIFYLGFVVACQPNNTLHPNTPTVITTATPENEVTSEQAMLPTTTLLPSPTTMPEIMTVPTNTPIGTPIPTGELHILSEPEGALASIISEGLSSQVPVVWTILPGTYTVTLTLDGYEDWIAPLTVAAGSKTRVTATLRKHHIVIPIDELQGPLYALQWSEDGQSLTYALADKQWPPHVQSLPVYQSWWRYDVTSGTRQALPPPQTRVTNAVRESLAVCPFPISETDPFPYPCWTTLHESPTDNRIVFSSGTLVGRNDANTWLANIDGSDVIYLDKFPGSPEDVKWSTDGQWLLIGRYYGASVSSNIYYLVSSDGTFVQSLEEITNINHGLVEGPTPQFSPDGQKIAFVGMETGGRQLTWDQQNQEEAYNLYVLDLDTMEYQMVSPRFGMFQWSDDGNGLYILDGSASTSGNREDYIDDLVEGKVNYADFYSVDLTQYPFPEQKLAGDIPLHLPYSGAWSYSPEANAMVGTFDLDSSIFGILWLK